MSNTSWPSATSNASQSASAPAPTVEPTPPAETPTAAGAVSEAPKEGEAAEKSPEAVAAEARQAKLARDAEFIRRRQAEKAKRNAWRDEKARVIADAKAKEERLAALEKQLADITAKKGVNPLLEAEDPNAVIREFIAKGTPEAKAYELERQVQEEKKARLALEERIANEAKQREENDRKARETYEAQRVEAALNGFVGMMTAEQGKKFPYSNLRWSPDEIRAQAHAIHQRALETRWRDEHGREHIGVQYPVEQVAEYLERQAKEWHKSVEDKRNALLGVASPTTPTSPASTPRAPSASPGKAPAQSASKGRVLNPEEQREEDLKNLRRAFEADRIAHSKKK